MNADKIWTEHDTSETPEPLWLPGAFCAYRITGPSATRCHFCRWTQSGRVYSAIRR